VRFLTVLFILIASVVAGSCGDTPTQPTTLTVSSITPTSGTTLGGTPITITGSNFSAGAIVTVGGVAATDVTVNGSTLLTAVTPQHAAGAGDVVVTSGGRTGRLTAAFTYVAPAATINTPPVIGLMTARGTRPNEPAEFADLDEQINVTAVVTDAETASAQLTYEWNSNAGGTFTGSGVSVQWRAPISPPLIPINASLTLTVIERYASVDSSGLPLTQEHRVSKSISVSVHDSRKEVGDMARQFLLDFSDSSIQDVDYIMRNFTDASQCAGEKASETSDVTNNRRNKRITSFRVEQPSVSVNFGGTCPFRVKPADACAHIDVEWRDVALSNGSVSHTRGTDQVTAVYVAAQHRWGLCGSDYDGVSLPTGARVTRMP
jgi:hypothetical protein